MILLFLLKRAPSPKGFLIADLGLLEGSVPGDRESYPESVDALVAVNLEGSVR